jgi:VWFA-related protein
VALIQTPHRFRTKRQLWAYSGLALETRTSGEHCYVQGQLRRSKKQVSIRGLNKDHNHDLKGLFKAAATRASVQPGPFQDFYQASLAKGIKPTMVRLTLARQTGRRAWREFGRVQGLSSMLAPILDQPRTQIAVLAFDSQLNLAQDFTDDAAQIAKCLHHLEPGDRGAAILDAVQYAVRLLNKTPEGSQKVLLLISETRDHGSHFAKIDDVVALIGSSNTTVYTLAFSPTISNILDTERGNNQDEMNSTVDLIALLAQARAAMKSNTPKAIASQTGGEYELFESRQRFETRMMDFTNHLHNRYVLSFVPKILKPGLHQIRVRLKQPGATTTLARSSYWVAAPNQQ